MPFFEPPTHFSESFTKYPHGKTLFESVCKWLEQTNNLADDVNNMLTTGIDGPLQDAINELALSGELADLIQQLVVVDGGTF